MQIDSNHYKVNYWTLLSLYLASLLLGAILYIATSDLWANENEALVVCQVISQFVSIGIFFVLNKSELSLMFRKFKESLTTNLGWCVIGYLIMLVVTIPAVASINGAIVGIGKIFNHEIIIPDNSENQKIISDLLRAGGITTIATISLTIIAAPIFEELIFRHAIIKIFSTMNLKKIGYILSATLFGLIHVAPSSDFVSITPYLVSGILFVAIYHKAKGNIVFPILIHSMWNLVVTLIVIFS